MTISILEWKTNTWFFPRSHLIIMVKISEDPLEKRMATHCSILAWRIPWTKEPGGLQSMGSQKVRQDWVTGVIESRQELQCFRKNNVPVMSTIGWNVRKSRESYQIGMVSRIRRWRRKEDWTMGEVKWKLHQLYHVKKTWIQSIAQIPTESRGDLNGTSLH